MKKPRLTARIVRGLESVYALADVNRFEDSDLYTSIRAEDGGNRPEAEADRLTKEIDDAIEWLGRLIEWHGSKSPVKSAD